jgi:phosphoglycerate kinase
MDSVQRIMHEAKDQGVSLLLPSDVVVAKTLEITDTSSQVTSDRIPEGWKIMDIGSDTINRFSSQLTGCKTVLWNGPMGIFEIPRFAKGTEAIASTIANLNAITVIGGGSTAEAVGKLGLASSMTHVSTGGGASLMFLEGKELPGIAVLCDK